MTDPTSNPTPRLVGADDLGERILDSVSAEIAVLDNNGTIVYVNEAWKRFSEANGGSPNATGVGVNYLEVCHTARGEDSAHASDAGQGIEDVLSGKRDSFKLEYPCHAPPRKRWFLLYVTPLRGAPDAAVATHVSITERKITEQRLLMTERLAAIGQAMAGMSHEGRKSLQRSQASIDLLRLHLAEDAEALELLDRVGESQARLLGVYEQVRSYAAPVSVRYETFPLDQIVTELFSELTSRGSSIQFSHTHSLGSLECDVDVSSIKLVFDLVLENALEGTEGASEVNVSYRAVDIDGSSAITIIVSDDGPGIPIEHHDEVFEPFYSTKPNGTGLGLAMCQRLIAAHGGTIRIGKPLLGGTSVYITLPTKRLKMMEGP